MDSIDGDKKRFLQLMSENQGIINSVCKMYSREAERFKDMRQEVILQLWKSLPAFRNESKISTWIYRVAFNTILSQRRSDYKHSGHLALSQAHIESLAVLPLADDEIQQLMFIISQLEDRDKAMVLLYLEGYSHQEMADILAMTATNISTRMNRVKARLKTIYQIRQHEAR